MTTYQVGDPDPVRAVYLSTGLASWDACCAQDPSIAPALRVCQWPRQHPHLQHVAVASGRITAVWSDDQP